MVLDWTGPDSTSYRTFVQQVGQIILGFRGGRGGTKLYIFIGLYSTIIVKYSTTGVLLLGNRRAFFVHVPQITSHTGDMQRSSGCPLLLGGTSYSNKHSTLLCRISQSHHIKSRPETIRYDGPWAPPLRPRSFTLFLFFDYYSFLFLFYVCYSRNKKKAISSRLIE